MYTHNDNNIIVTIISIFVIVALFCWVPLFNSLIPDDKMMLVNLYQMAQVMPFSDKLLPNQCSLFAIWNHKEDMSKNEIKVQKLTFKKRRLKKDFQKGYLFVQASMC